jgi:16S rRNA (cytosine967-C5)-methyltransferase
MPSPHNPKASRAPRNPNAQRKPDPSSVSAARREAFAILLEVEKGHGHSDDLLRDAKVSELSLPDRHLCTALVMGTLRWQIVLDAQINPLLARPNGRLDPEIRIALRLGAFQLFYLDRIPDHAAISESVGLAKLAGHKFASGMVNAVLRKLASQSKPVTQSAENLSAAELAAATAHPAWLVERWVARYGLQAAEAICRHGQQQPAHAIRLSAPEVETELATDGIVLDPGTLLTAARLVLSGDVSATASYLDGDARIQEEGSQLIAELAGHGARILDCCAAPGGKTLILAERNPGSRIVACEVNPARLKAMRQRFADLNPEITDRIDLLEADATQLPADQTAGQAYDVVLADVPCSGTGTLGRNPEIRHRPQEPDLARHHERQVAILRGALNVASANGRVVYSTCSLEPEENESVVAEVLAGAEDWQQISLAESIRELQSEGRLTETGTEYLLENLAEDGSLHLLPGKIATDSFFVVLLQRR